LIELLKRGAAEGADRSAVVGNDRVTTYGELLADARRIAGALSHRGIRRFGILDYDAANVIALLAAASLTGAEACIYPPTDTAAGLTELAQRFDHDLVITDHTDVVGGVPTLALAELRGDRATPADEPPEQRPLLVLTTGTTGVPRGVRHDWWRVLRTADRIAATPDERWLLAYGMHQFGGLQILVHVVAARATLIAPAPRLPAQGLAAMREHGVTHASATPTYWRFLIAQLRSDGGPVPELHQITLGGEAVAAALLEQIEAAFPHAGVSQVYGANEFGTTGTVRDRRNGLPLSVLERGDDANIAMKIVDGELWARSKVGSLGYYDEPAGDPNAWRPTGDLVEIDGDRVAFRGRRSDEINVGGVKVHPLPVEERVLAVAGVRFARAYGRPNTLTGAILAVEVVPEPGADTGEVDAAIRAACSNLAPAARPRSIRFVESIVTTGDKVVRRMSDD
jgi:acyl-CoA synthetase (AMP-forming)/AMP-acid ligase II